MSHRFSISLIVVSVVPVTQSSKVNEPLVFTPREIMLNRTFVPTVILVKSLNVRNFTHGTDGTVYLH